MTVVELKTGGSREAIEELELKGKPAAILVENGRVTNRVDLQNDYVKYTVALMKILSEKPSEGKSCEAELAVDKKGWEIKPEPSSTCKRELSNVSKLPPNVQKYLKKHLET